MRAAWGWAWLALVVSCTPYPIEPRAVRPETDVCPECRMTVVGGGYAAQAVGDGTVLMFDDPGCLALHAHDDPEHFAQLTAFVQDAQTQEWVKWDQAAFVKDDNVPTPMNYGWHAFATRARAEAFVATHPGAEALSEAPLKALADDLEARRWRP